MRKGLKLTLAVLIASSFVTSAFAQTKPVSTTPVRVNSYPNYSQNYQPYTPTYSNQYNYMPPLQGRVVTIPAGSTLAANTVSTISSEYLTVGDTVNVSLGSDFYAGGSIALPAGSTVEGNVVLAEKAGRTGKNAKLKIKFTSVITPSGQRIPISGKIKTNDETGILLGGTTAGRVGDAAKNAAVGAGVGALMGTIMGPLSGGKVGKGAVYGTAVGGGLGLGKALIDKGGPVEIPAGSPVNIVLDQPATISPVQAPGY